MRKLGFIMFQIIFLINLNINVNVPLKCVINVSFAALMNGRIWGSWATTETECLDMASASDSPYPAILLHKNTTVAINMA